MKAGRYGSVGSKKNPSATAVSGDEIVGGEMRIREVNIRKNLLKDYGLPDIEMTRLERVVVVAGPNGIGKTRLLKAIRRCGELRNELADESFDELESEKKVLVGTLKSASISKLNQAERDALEDRIDKIRKKSEIISSLKVDASHELRLPIVEILPKKSDLATIGSQTLSQIRDRASRLRRGDIELDGLSDSAFSYIFSEQNSYFEATHPERGNYRGNANEIIARYKRLENSINDFLGAKLSRSAQGEPMLFGQTLDMHGLSAGQIVLLQIAIALHAREQDLRNSILFLDEPENHLHSAALIEVVDNLLSKIGSGQIWICTHSIPLIAHLASIDPFYIWYMNREGVERAGRKPETILQGLLGRKDARQNLFNFLKLPQELAAANYASQCLLPPQVIAASAKTDPQLSQIAKQLRERAELEMRAVKILDFGAGKGRLLSGLYENFADNEGSLSQYVDYYAFEPEHANRDLCQEVIDNVYGRGVDRYFWDLEQIKSKNLRFDVVCLCNVLHEIHPDEWWKLFREDMQSILDEGGSVLLVEDHHLPTGERAHEFGFIMLDTDELSTLFSVQPGEGGSLFRFADERGDGRLKAHAIHRTLLERLTEESQLGAFKALCGRALREIANLRKIEGPDYSTGQRLGLWTQLLANASLFLHARGNG
ncbi:AAA family ATPase [Ralstonia wenshanensis]|nr:AAA family ATPase [Ralstonia wenshanensis]